MPLGENRVMLSPKVVSQGDGPNRGKSYGEIGTQGALAHESQMAGDTEKFLKQWQNNPDEVLAPIIPNMGMKPLLTALGKVEGMVVIEGSVPQTKLSKLMDSFKSLFE